MPITSRVITSKLFGEHDTGTVLKLDELSQDQSEQLNHAQTHNLSEERSVGFVNYELDIRGEQNLEAVSRKTLSFDKAKTSLDVPIQEIFCGVRKGLASRNERNSNVMIFT